MIYEVDVSVWVTGCYVETVTVEAGDEQEAARTARAEARELAPHRQFRGEWLETEVFEIREVGE